MTKHERGENSLLVSHWEIEQFTTHGFHVFHSIWTETETIFARKQVAEVVGRFRANEDTVVRAGVSVGDSARKHPERNADIVADQWDREPFIIGDLIALDCTFATLFGSPKIWELAAGILACPLPEVQFHFSNITRKPALLGPAITWHRDSDNTYFSSADHRTVRLLFPLQVMQKSNGGTEIDAGSQVLTRQSGPNVQCPTVSPGACLALHADVLHGSGANESPMDRDVIVLQFGWKHSTLTHSADECMSGASWLEILRFARAN